MIINGIEFGNTSCTINSVITQLKKKGKYWKCRVCGRKYVEVEGTLCENCRYFADLKYSNKTEE